MYIEELVKRVPFSAINNPGNTIKHLDKYYIIIEGVEDSNYSNYNVVDLENGDLFYISKDELVIPLNGKFLVER